ncbi:2-isopropylmalate synthase [Kiloniella laminariae]|uniref:2-isopropylmalate synthase n=1 Tax=Kiloniella laminariae TaxID=454162 RepID=A0ABT4LL07_9PROT|nr:2-isopropylmalate synthase [Kiloniella laminariae]MCZ4281759.1 2-isopropylmalate synthase [Kiloniella laminariae]
MQKMPFERYRAFEQVKLENRSWPNKTITQAPIWCSVDLRDGNQALIEPMDTTRKKKMFNLLVEMGFKEIEVGFPSASQTDFDFLRMLIEKDMIPDDVTIQVLTQAREHLIRRTFESIQGAKSAIVHLYNSTSELQRRVVFREDKQGIIDIAVKGAELIKELIPTVPGTKIIHQYSPESFTGTELPFARDICEAVMDVWEASPENKVILNLPATVEMSTPNVHADQIEWFCANIKNRDSVIISLHPHNDRGTGIAATELGLLAGADRVEGTLFGNGERTGNVDLVTLAVNMMTQGVDPKLDISDINRIKDTAEYCNQLPVHPRHPWVGELVYTAFSGSHQDAIKKGMTALKASNEDLWEVPYLPIDPQDIGRSYEAIIRINSQSGKGGVAYIMQTDYHMELPKALQVDFSKRIQHIAETTGKEITPEVIWETFDESYLRWSTPLQFKSHTTVPDTHAAEIRHLTAQINFNGEARQIMGKGNGPVAGFINAVAENLGVSLSVEDYHQHSLTHGSDAKAVAYLELKTDDGQTVWGIGIDSNTTVASIRAIVSATNQILGK